jgi:O-antigen/teichoic acid export membrane protein
MRRSPGDPSSSRLARLIGQRGRTIANTAAWSLAAKGASAANLFLSVPFVLQALGPAQFGAWAALVSLVMFAGFLDFGFGNGTMNLVAQAHGRDADAQIAGIARAGLRSLLQVAAILGALSLALLPVIPWHRLLGLPAEFAQASRDGAAAVLLCLTAAVPLNLAQRVQLGMGRGDQAFRWQAIGQLLALLAVAALARLGASLPVLTWAAVGTPLLAAAVNSALLWRSPALRAPSSARAQRGTSRHIRREGFQFFLMQLAAALAFSSDLPLIASLAGPEQAGVYAIAQRVFSIIPLSLGLVWTPLWPIYRKAMASGDHAWVKRTLRRSLLLGVSGAAAAGILFVLAFPPVAQWWMHRTLAIGPWLLLGFAAWSVAEALGTALATFLNAAGVTRIQVAAACCFAPLCVAAKIGVLEHARMDWLPWTTLATYVAAVLLPLLLWRNAIRRELAQRWPGASKNTGPATRPEGTA